MWTAPLSPIERRMPELRGAEALLVVGAYAEHSADVHIRSSTRNATDSPNVEAVIPRTSTSHHHHHLAGHGPVKGEGHSESTAVLRTTQPPDSGGAASVWGAQPAASAPTATATATALLILLRQAPLLA